MWLSRLHKNASAAGAWSHNTRSTNEERHRFFGCSVSRSK
jgi:hypothetical protein